MTALKVREVKINFEQGNGGNAIKKLANSNLYYKVKTVLCVFVRASYSCETNECITMKPFLQHIFAKTDFLLCFTSSHRNLAPNFSKQFSQIWKQMSLFQLNFTLQSVPKVQSLQSIMGNTLFSEVQCFIFCIS